MEDEERIATTICHIAGMVICFFIMLVLCAMCSSCTTTQYIPVIEHHTDTLIQTKVQKDIIWLHDSTIVEKDDSIIKIEHWHTKYVDREVHDTTYVSKTDTVPVPYPVIKEVEKPLSKMQKTLMGTGIFSLTAIIIAIAWRVKRFLL